LIVLDATVWYRSRPAGADYDVCEREEDDDYFSSDEEDVSGEEEVEEGDSDD